MHSPNTIDCASCHVAQSARDLIGEDVLDISETGNKNAFVADPKWISARRGSTSTC